MSLQSSFLQEDFAKEFKASLLDATADGSAFFETSKIDSDDEPELPPEFGEYLEDLWFQKLKPKKKLQNPCPLNETFCKFREDMTAIIEGKVYKKVLSQGTDELDLERQVVSFEFSMFLEGKIESIQSSESKPAVVNVTEGKEPLAGCYLALASMCLDEESLFWISSDLMFGKLGGAPSIPPNSDILLHVKIVRAEYLDDEPSCVIVVDPFKKLMRDAKKNFMIAVQESEQRDHRKAINIYQKWIRKLEETRLANEEQELAQRKLLAKMYQNVAQLYNKIEQPQKCCLAIRELEKLQSIRENSKALFAKGKAQLMLDDFVEARKYLLMAQRLAPDSSTIAAEIAKLNERQQTKDAFDAETKMLKEKFEAEAFEIKKREQEEQENRDADLKIFRIQMEAFLINFKESGSDIMSLPMDIRTEDEYMMAKELCLLYKLSLKGTQMLNGESHEYFVSK